MHFSSLTIDELIEQEIEEKGLMFYKEALDNIRLAIAIVYEKHAVDGKLDWGEMLKYGRLDKLEETIKEEMKRLNRRQQNFIKTLLKNVYQAGYYSTAFSIEEED